MTLRVKRLENENKGLQITGKPSDYIIFVCVNMTKDNHMNAMNELLTIYNLTTKMDIYFQRNLISVFACETDAKLESEDIKQMLNDYSHVVVYDGKVFGRQLNDINAILRSDDSLELSKKFKALLVMKENW